MAKAPKRKKVVSKRPSAKKIAKAPGRLARLKKKIVKKLFPKKVVKKSVRKTVVRRILQAPAIPTPVQNHVPAPTPSYADHRVPHQYGDDRLVLLVRDPWWIYAYWEVTSGRQEWANHQARQSGARDWKTVLRVYDVTGTTIDKARSHFDIELNFFADNWYVDVGLPDREWAAELGLRTSTGKFIVMVRSNVVRTPSFGISDVLDEEWMLPEEIYYRIIGLSGPGTQSGSMDIRRMLEKYLKQVMSSERLTQAPSLK